MSFANGYLRKKRNFEQEIPIKTIPDWNDIRGYIDKIPDSKSTNELKNSLKILYIFSLMPNELVRKSTEKESLRGTDLVETTIEGEQALILNIPTSKRGGKIRKTAIPLNPKYEPWAKDILNYCENLSDDYIYHKVFRELQVDVKLNCFLNYEWYAPLYRGKSEEAQSHATTKNEKLKMSLRTLQSIREWELCLCHGFDKYDFMNFYGREFGADYNEYFEKLLHKNDYYFKDDFLKAVELYETVFCPSHWDVYDYKDYMEVVKKLKRKQIIQSPLVEINLADNVDRSKYKYFKGQGESKDHTELKIGFGDYLVNQYGSTPEQISYETSNLDVVDYKNKIIVECGHTSPAKLLDSFNDVLTGITNVNEFWVAQFCHKKGVSKCHKFIKPKHLLIDNSMLKARM